MDEQFGPRLRPVHLIVLAVAVTLSALLWWQMIVRNPAAEQYEEARALQGEMETVRAAVREQILRETTLQRAPTPDEREVIRTRTESLLQQQYAGGDIPLELQEQLSRTVNLDIEENLYSRTDTSVVRPQPAADTGIRLY